MRRLWLLLSVEFQIYQMHQLPWTASVVTEKGNILSAALQRLHIWRGLGIHRGLSLLSKLEFFSSLAQESRLKRSAALCSTVRRKSVNDVYGTFKHAACCIFHVCCDHGEYAYLSVDSRELHTTKVQCIDSLLFDIIHLNHILMNPEPPPLGSEVGRLPRGALP